MIQADNEMLGYAALTRATELPNLTIITPSLENPSTPVPPFEKGGLGGICQNPALATEKMESEQ